MSEAIEKKLPVKNLERIVEHTFPNYETASLVAQRGPKDYTYNGETLRKGDQTVEVAKVKIFARRNGTFDVVWYKKIETAGQKVIKALQEAVQTTSEAPAKQVHGLKSKDRKKSPKKAR